MSDMPPVFEIHACSHDLTISELDWTASDAAKSYAFTYGWVRASQARDLVKEIERLRARVAVLERACRLIQADPDPNAVVECTACYRHSRLAYHALEATP